MKYGKRSSVRKYRYRRAFRRPGTPISLDEFSRFLKMEDGILWRHMEAENRAWESIKQLAVPGSGRTFELKLRRE